MRPRRRVVAALVLAALALVACGDPPASDEEVPGSPVPSPPSTWAYTCPEGPRITVHYREAEARVTLPARELVLPRDTTASGARYRSDEGILWDRGGEAILEVGSARYSGCEGRPAGSSEDAARLLGFDFRGLGQEPGWLVDVDADRQVRWLGDYGSVRFATGAPAAEEVDDGTVVWTAEDARHRITVRASPRECRDAMSGRPFSHTVEVTVDARTYSGCGLWLEND